MLIRIYIAVILLFAACTPPPEGETLTVSIPPLKYFPERIAGEGFRINTLVGKGNDPHSFDLTASQIRLLRESKVCISTGILPFETGQLRSVLKTGKECKLTELATSILYCRNPSCNSGHDPHIWSLPENGIRIAETIARTLSEIYPEKAEVFRENSKRLTDSIKAADSRLREIFASKKHKAFIIYHPSLTSFAEAYGIRQIAIEKEGKEPGINHMKRVIEEAKCHKARLVLIQSLFERQNAETVAGEISGLVREFDPLPEDWMKEIRKLSDIFNECME